MTVPTFTVEVFHEPHTEVSERTLDVVVTVTAHDDGRTAPGAHVIMVDCSGSMRTPESRMAAVRAATREALDALPDGALVAVIAGNHEATVAFPAGDGMVALSPARRAEAASAVERLVASGGTAMGAWLVAAARLLAAHPDRLRHAVLLTDGRNEHESAEAFVAALALSEGVFTCDARGVGGDVGIEDLRTVATRLLGTVDLVAAPEDLAAEMRRTLERAGARTPTEPTLRVWTPPGVSVRTLTQVTPTVEELARRPHPAGLYPTGAWGAAGESRDYHLRLDVGPGAGLEVGERVVVARVAMASLRSGRGCGGTPIVVAGRPDRGESDHPADQGLPADTGLPAVAVDVRSTRTVRFRR